MEHAEAEKLFELYFANHLGREETKAFHAHLNTCEDCKVRIRAMRAHGRSPFRSVFARGESEEGRETRFKNQLYRNRVITYAVIGVMVAFFLLLRMLR